MHLTANLRKLQEMQGPCHQAVTRADTGSLGVVPAASSGRDAHWGRAWRMAFTSSATAVSANSNCSCGDKNARP